MRDVRLHCEKIISMEAQGLSEGYTTRDIECPFCPSSDKERGSLSVTRTGGELVYHCFRNKCGAKGYITQNAGDKPAMSVPERKRKEKSDVHILKNPVEDLTNEHIRLLMVNYEITLDEIQNNNIRWCPSLHKVAVPLHDKYGRQWGWEAKRLKGYKKNPAWNVDMGAKSIIYKEVPNANRLAYPYLTPMEDTPTRRECDTLVLVEDIFSAIRVNRYKDAVALLGHTIDYKAMLEVAGNYAQVRVALDPDALDKAQDIENKYAYYFDNFDVIYLANDPKDCSDEELQRVFDV